VDVWAFFSLGVDRKPTPCYSPWFAINPLSHMEELKAHAVRVADQRPDLGVHGVIAALETLHSELDKQPDTEPVADAA